LGALDTILNANGTAIVATTLAGIFVALVPQFIDLIAQVAVGISISSLASQWLGAVKEAAGDLLLALFKKLLAWVGLGGTNSPSPCDMDSKGSTGATGSNTSKGCFTYNIRFRDSNGKPLLFPAASPIENRVTTVATNDGVQQVAAEDSIKDARHYRLVSLYLEQEPGDYVKARRVFPAAWLAEREAVVGSRLHVDLAEMGMCGEAEVTAIDPCPPVRPGPGRLILGTYMHSRAVVYDLWVTGEPEAIGVTALHPFWSAHRRCWVNARDLRPGERLLAQHGTTPRVESLALRSAAEQVYNIEVEGDHCYRVGQQGLLVHNNSIPCNILVSFGNSTKPADVRVPQDITVDANGDVNPPPQPVTATSNVPGKSLYGDPAQAPLTGWWWWIPGNPTLPSGIAIIADGSDVGGTQPPTHHTLYPTIVMSLGDFNQKYLSLGWMKGQKK
jgi:hypothetical protein